MYNIRKYIVQCFISHEGNKVLLKEFSMHGEHHAHVYELCMGRKEQITEKLWAESEALQPFDKTTLSFNVVSYDTWLDELTKQQHAFGKAVFEMVEDPHEFEDDSEAA